MKIRRATQKDIGGLIEVHKSEIKNVSRSVYKREFQDILRKPFRETYVLIENSKVKGYVTLNKDFPGYKNCEITRFFVHKKYRRKGIGKKILDYVEKRLRSKFLRLCAYTAETKNKGVRRFYEKCGFKVVSKFPYYFERKRGNPKNAVLYCKELK